MSNQYLPTKSNLLKIQESIRLSKQGRELLERKRLILMKEKEKYRQQAKELRNTVDEMLRKAMDLFQQANIDMGFNLIHDIAEEIPKEHSIDIKYKTVMGVEIPSIVYHKTESKDQLNYGFHHTTISFDKSVVQFYEKLIQLAELENTVSRLEASIMKVQTRSNALENIIIPRDENIAKRIKETLEEKEREDFSRLKLIKKKIG